MQFILKWPFFSFRRFMGGVFFFNFSYGGGGRRRDEVWFFLFFFSILNVGAECGTARCRLLVTLSTRGQKENYRGDSSLPRGAWERCALCALAECSLDPEESVSLNIFPCPWYSSTPWPNHNTA